MKDKAESSKPRRSQSAHPPECPSSRLQLPVELKSNARSQKTASPSLQDDESLSTPVRPRQTFPQPTDLFTKSPAKSSPLVQRTTAYNMDLTDADLSALQQAGTITCMSVASPEDNGPQTPSSFKALTSSYIPSAMTTPMKPTGGFPPAHSLNSTVIGTTTTYVVYPPNTPISSFTSMGPTLDSTMSPWPPLRDSTPWPPSPLPVPPSPAHMMPSGADFIPRSPYSPNVRRSSPTRSPSPSPRPYPRMPSPPRRRLSDRYQPMGAPGGLATPPPVPPPRFEFPEERFYPPKRPDFPPPPPIRVPEKPMDPPSSPSPPPPPPPPDTPPPPTLPPATPPPATDESESSPAKTSPQVAAVITGAWTTNDGRKVHLEHDALNGMVTGYWELGAGPAILLSLDGTTVAWVGTKDCRGALSVDRNTITWNFGATWHRGGSESTAASPRIPLTPGPLMPHYVVMSPNPHHRLPGTLSPTQHTPPPNSSLSLKDKLHQYINQISDRNVWLTSTVDRADMEHYIPPFSLTFPVNEAKQRIKHMVAFTGYGRVLADTSKSMQIETQSQEVRDLITLHFDPIQHWIHIHLTELHGPRDYEAARARVNQFRLFLQQCLPKAIPVRQALAYASPTRRAAQPVPRRVSFGPSAVSR